MMTRRMLTHRMTIRRMAVRLTSTTRFVGGAAFVACSAITAFAPAAQAQSVRDQCTTAATGSVTYCESLADIALTLPARFAIAASGGNPVPGTASTLGMRMPGSPRWSMALRTTVARASLPPLEGERAQTPTIWSINVDGTVGLFNGFNLAPTIGGFGSIDVLGSLGLITLPESDGFERSSPLTWSLGARVGILRESFTAPGVSVSAQYRSLPDVEWGEPDPGPYFATTDQSVLSLRATAGKRVLGIGLAAGVGHDRVSSDVSVRYNEPGPMFPNPVAADEQGVVSARTSFFGNASYTILILNMAAEIGWQEDGDRAAGAHGDTGTGGLFGGLAFRIAI